MTIKKSSTRTLYNEQQLKYSYIILYLRTVLNLVGILYGVGRRNAADSERHNTVLDHKCGRLSNRLCNNRPFTIIIVPQHIYWTKNRKNCQTAQRHRALGGQSVHTATSWPHLVYGRRSQRCVPFEPCWPSAHVGSRCGDNANESTRPPLELLFTYATIALDSHCAEMPGCMDWPPPTQFVILVLSPNTIASSLQWNNNSLQGRRQTFDRGPRGCN